MHRLLQLGVDLFYPPRCVGCGAFGPVFCQPCRAALRPTTVGPRCPLCSARWEDDGNCPRCFNWRDLDGGFAAVDLEGPARRVVHGLKYSGMRTLVPVMAEAIAPLARRVPFDVALAVPLHPSRERHRGFNQAELILARLAWPRPAGRLRRTRKTGTQVGMHERERRQNVDDAFAYEGPPLDGLTVALVDDVITTGATMQACAKVLKEHGPRSVVAISYARANYFHGSLPFD